MKYALIAWLFGGYLWLDADPMTKTECVAVMVEVMASDVVYVAEGLPPIERLGCFPIMEA